MATLAAHFCRLESHGNQTSLLNLMRLNLMRGRALEGGTALPGALLDWP
jgi:hypothetical protein